MSECIEWGGYRNKDGYGRHRANGRMVLAHRHAYECANGPVPAGMYVLHRCDNPACINPAHLFLGTQRDNMQDQIAKGRRHCVAGAKNPAAKLTLEQVTEIRSLVGKMQGKEIAAQFGITPGRVSQIKLRPTWLAA